MSKDEIIQNTINKYHQECSKIIETEFIDKLEKIKSNEDIAKRYALNGYKFVQKKYNIKCYVKNIESIYDNVLNG